LQKPDLPEALCGRGYCALQNGELGAAQRDAQQATEVDPSDPAAWQLLGRTLKRLGQTEEAERCFRRALQAAPEREEARIELGIMLRARGDLEGAGDQYRAVLKRNPGSFEARVNLANVLADLGHAEEAIEHFHRAIEMRSDAADATVNLGKLLVSLDRLDEAEALLTQAQARFPMDGRVYRELGAVQQARGEWAAAGHLYQRAAGLMQDDLPVHHLMGEVALKLLAYGDAALIYRRCLELDPTDVTAVINLSLSLRVLGTLGEALTMARRAVELKPDEVEAHASVADALAALGRAREADLGYREALKLFPDRILTNHPLTATYVDTISPEELLERHKEVGAQYYGMVQTIHPHANSKDPDRPLLIGYLSGDLRLHSVTDFLEPILVSHDPASVEVACYHTQPWQDETTEKLKRCSRIWVQAEQMSDDALVQRIRDDGVDILVDLSGHTWGNRLQAIAHKPAPIQVLYLGYPTSSGLPAIDYRISDWYVDPPGSEALNSETVVRMPHSYYCYRAYPESPDVVPPPAAQRGFITFASFNNLAKVSDTAIALWSEVLRTVPRSRLLFKARGVLDPTCQDGLRARFGACGVDAQQIQFAGWNDVRTGHLSIYNEVDIGLDTYPYNGGTTTCEALWMGVPVVTLAGPTHASRMGASLLTAAGLSELVAGDAASFVRIAATLAQDHDRLARFRFAMRDQLSGSPLMDARSFTRSLEGVYREMWRRWCGQS